MILQIGAVISGIWFLLPEYDFWIITLKDICLSGVQKKLTKSGLWKRGLQSGILLKKDWHRCFSLKFVQISRAVILC